MAKTDKLTDALPYLTWVVAILASLISLSLSEIFNLTPCVLCWFQRIFMYPLPFIIGVAIWRKDLKNLAYYVLPLALIGLAIAFYHTLLQWDVIPEAAAPCREGISCTTKQINYFGFITIPFGSFISFLFISASMFIYQFHKK